MGFLNMFTWQDPGEELARALAAGACLVDVRSPGEYAAGSVEGAVNIPLDDLYHQLDRLRGKEPIVVFCRSGNRSRHARELLVKQGFRNVINGGTVGAVAAQLLKKQTK